MGRGARRVIVRPVQPLVAAGEGGVQVERLHVGVAVQAAEQQRVTVGQAGGLKQNSSVCHTDDSMTHDKSLTAVLYTSR